MKLLHKPSKVDGSLVARILIGPLHLIGIWCGEDQTVDIINLHVYERSEYVSNSVATSMHHGVVTL